MYQIKKRIYLNFDKTQKSAVCNYIRALVKQGVNTSANDEINNDGTEGVSKKDYSVETMLEKFIEEQQYYLDINASRFPYLKDVISDEQFLNDTKDFIKECIKYYEYKLEQKPIIEANKEFEKKKRKFLQEVKMSKETPTKKQLYYYDRLCKKYQLEKKDVNSYLN